MKEALVFWLLLVLKKAVHTYCIFNAFLHQSTKLHLFFLTGLGIVDLITFMTDSLKR